ncbi:MULTISPECIES: sensor histidine kinase [Streptosporangium]|uniref:histidine kinase n=1 Tax=Streptosporangium brasiliense TaxID=47480 RepID=A0ABT9R5P7_9ACTN|nr:histidine kinase [Streptosporangium brasiliense]MDP9864187.1 signal transduction histidine kinase [Streptosporangium brasiliense]
MDLVAALLALAAMTVALVPRVPPAWPAMAAGAISIAITAAHPLGGWHSDAISWTLAEVPPLLALTLLAVRHAPAPQAAVSAGLAGGAVALMLVRVLWPGDFAFAVGSCAGWALLAVAAAGVGLYLRMLDSGRRRAVAEAKRTQRLVLARDLHDFVAHDVSGILVQAQAAQLAPGPLPPQVADALRRIEEAGQRALTAMDRTVQMLHGADEAGSGTAGALPGVDGLAQLVAGYSPSVRVDLSVDPGLERQLSQETSATVYRVVTEALTNVRRHASEATSVAIAVARVGESVRVRVTDDGGGHSEAAGRGGFGLVGLTERAEVLGGSLSAGPEPGGWRVEALLPAHPPRRLRHAGARVRRPTADRGEPT